MQRKLRKELDRIAREIEYTQDKLVGLREHTRKLVNRLDTAKRQSESVEVESPTPPSAVEAEADPVHALKSVEQLEPTEQSESAGTAKAVGKIVEAKGRKATEVADSSNTAKPKQNWTLEQRAGISWLNKAGIAALVLAAIFYFQYAAKQGWVSPAIRVTSVALSGFALLGLGEWAHRKAMRVFASGVNGGGIILLYAAAYAASPNFYGLLSMSMAFAMMALATAIGIGVSLRVRRMEMAVLAQIGAYATPLLMPVGAEAQYALVGYLLMVSAGFMLIAMVRRWQPLPVLAFLGSVLVFGVWCGFHYRAAVAVETTGCGWALFGAFAVFLAIGVARQRFVAIMAESLLALATIGLILQGALQIEHLSDASLLAQWFVLDAIVLGLCFAWNTHWVRLFCLALTIRGMAAMWTGDHQQVTWFWTPWIWGFYGLFMFDVLARTLRSGDRTGSRVSAALMSASTAAMFATTYALLNRSYSEWMGLYAFTMAVWGLSFWAFVRRRAGHAPLATACLLAGLTMLGLAPAIQFDMAVLTFTWAGQAVVTMFVARLAKSRWLLIKAFIVFGLALAHFVIVDAVRDDTMKLVLMTINGVEIKRLLAMAMLLTGLALVGAAIAGQGMNLLPGKTDRYLTAVMVWFGVLIGIIHLNMALPTVAATWSLIVLAGFVWFLRPGPSDPIRLALVYVLLALILGKFVLFDTIGVDVSQSRLPLDWPVVFNWQAASAVVMIAMTAWLLRIWTRVDEDRTGWDIAGKCLGGGLLVVGLWAGMVEIARGFETGRITLFPDAGTAQQMAYSVWWVVYAASLLIAGFVTSRQGLRIFALVLFAVTMVKVLIVDMANVNAAYRIASFFALGAAMVGASLLYQKHARPNKIVESAQSNAD